MEKIKLNVDGMHCQSCEILISDALKEKSGVIKVKADSKAGYVEAEWDNSKIKKEDIIETIKKEGFKVRRQ